MAVASVVRSARWAVVVAALAPLAFGLLQLDVRTFGVAADSPSYVQPGAAFWRTGSFTTTLPRGTVPEMDRTPPYALLAGLFALSGDVHVWPVVLIQIGLRILIVVLVLTLPTEGRIGRRDWRVVAAWLIALDLLSGLMAVQLLTETVSAFLLLLTCWCWLRWQTRQSLALAMAAGCACGLAALTRPINLIALLLLAGWAVWGTRSMAARARTATLVTLVAGALLLPGVWVARNYAWSGRFVFSLTPSRSLYEFRAAGIVAERDGRSLESVHHEFTARRSAVVSAGGLAPWEEAEWERGQAWPILRSAPGILARQAVAGLVRAVSGPGVKAWELWTDASRLKDARWLPIVLTGAAVVYLVALYGLSLIGLMRPGWRADPQVAIVCWTAFFLLLAAAAGPEAYSRFRVPVMPLASVGAAWLWREPVPAGEQE